MSLWVGSGLFACEPAGDGQLAYAPSTCSQSPPSLVGVKAGAADSRWVEFRITGPPALRPPRAFPHQHPPLWRLAWEPGSESPAIALCPRAAPRPPRAGAPRGGTSDPHFAALSASPRSGAQGGWRHLCSQPEACVSEPSMSRPRDVP